MKPRRSLLLIVMALLASLVPIAPVLGCTNTAHIIQPGETLWGIALRYRVSEAAIAQANGLANPGLIYAGQRLVIPSGGNPSAPPAPVSNPSTAAPPSALPGAKRIEVNLSTQQMYAYEGDRLILSSGVSTGRPGWETPAGNFRIYLKYPVQTMSGSANGETWYVPDVPHAMYFFQNAALHGTYWHNSFGTGARLSHGCVNLPLSVAAQLYNWAPIGTPVWVHY